MYYTNISNSISNIIIIIIIIYRHKSTLSSPFAIRIRSSFCLLS